MRADDLWKQYCEILRSDLAARGYVIPFDSCELDKALAFYNIERRRVRPKKRSVIKPPGFFCPPDRSQGLTLLENALKAGDDINPYLSRKLLNESFNDSLLNDWGIQHFHLGVGQDSKNPYFIKGTKELLFARVFEDEVRFLQILDHAAWAEESLLETMNSNWPDLIDPFRVPNARGLAISISPETRLQLRMAQVNAPVQLRDGSVIAPLGGGSMLNGQSTSAFSQAQSARKILGFYFRQIQLQEKDRVEAKSGKANWYSLDNDKGRVCIKTSDQQRSYILGKFPL